MKKECVFKRKRFILFSKSLFQKNGIAGKEPVVAGCPVFFP